MFGESFEIYLPQIAKNALKWSTMVGEKFEIYFHQMVKMHLNYPTGLDKIL